MVKKILVLISMNERQKQTIVDAAPGQEMVFALQETVTPEQVQWADIIVGNPPPAMLKGCDHLEWLQIESAGTNAYLGDVLPKGTILTNATGTYGLAISEYMLGMLLQIYYHLGTYHDNQKLRKWECVGQAKCIEGSTVLVLGLGDIGGSFARRAKALGAYTIGLRRADQNKPDYLDELYLTEELDRLLPRADVVALTLPATPQTYHIMGKKQLGLMKEDAVLINVGRGTCLDTQALCDTLAQGRLLGVALDVVDPEPLPPEHPLWAFPNAYITPHISGVHNLPETVERIVHLCARNLTAYLNGQELENIIDFETGYRRLK